MRRLERAIADRSLTPVPRAGVLAAFKSGKVDKDDVVTAVLNLAQSVEKTMDGTSGALVRFPFKDNETISLHSFPCSTRMLLTCFAR